MKVPLFSNRLLLPVPLAMPPAPPVNDAVRVPSFVRTPPLFRVTMESSIRALLWSASDPGPIRSVLPVMEPPKRFRLPLETKLPPPVRFPPNESEPLWVNDAAAGTVRPDAMKNSADAASDPVRVCVPDNSQKAPAPVKVVPGLKV